MTIWQKHTHCSPAEFPSQILLKSLTSPRHTPPSCRDKCVILLAMILRRTRRLFSFSILVNGVLVSSFSHLFHWFAKKVALFLNSALLRFLSSSSRLRSSCSCLISSSNLFDLVCSSICHTTQPLLTQRKTIQNSTFGTIRCFCREIKILESCLFCFFFVCIHIQKNDARKMRKIPLQQRNWPRLWLPLCPHQLQSTVCRFRTTHCRLQTHRLLPCEISAWTEKKTVYFTNLSLSQDVKKLYFYLLRAEFVFLVEGSLDINIFTVADYDVHRSVLRNGTDITPSHSPPWEQKLDNFLALSGPPSPGAKVGLRTILAQPELPLPWKHWLYIFSRTGGLRKKLGSQTPRLKTRLSLWSRSWNIFSLVWPIPPWKMKLSISGTKVMHCKQDFVSGANAMHCGSRYSCVVKKSRRVSALLGVRGANLPLWSSSGHLGLRPPPSSCSWAINESAERPASPSSASTLPSW